MKNKISAIIIAFFTIHFLIFLLLTKIPGSGFNTEGLTKQQIDQIGTENGFNQPLLIQYFNYWSAIIKLDFGKDINSNLDLQEKTINAFKLSLTYNATATVLALLTLSRYHRNEFSKNQKLVKTKFELFLVVIPYSIIVPLSVSLFAIQLKLVPAIYSSTNITSLLLPILIAGIYVFAQINFAVKSQLQYYKSSEWIKNKLKYNIPAENIFQKEIKPIINFEINQNISRLFIGLVFGSIIIEQAFELPGIGRLLVDSIVNKNIISAMNIVTLMLVLNLFVQIYSTTFAMRRKG
jgi:ABC-type dipeptide/oligopeptide/nickel transport system permease component